MTQCKEEVREPGPWPRWHRCMHKAVNLGEYCRVHSPEAVLERERRAQVVSAATHKRAMAPYVVARVQRIIDKYDNVDVSPTSCQREIIDELRRALKVGDG